MNQFSVFMQMMCNAGIPVECDDIDGDYVVAIKEDGQVFARFGFGGDGDLGWVEHVDQPIQAARIEGSAE